MVDESYSVPRETFSTEMVVKKSRFIAYASRAQTREKALSFLQTLKEQYPDARHHCWAYRIGHPKQPVTQAMSDDGEPSGTAGKPILNVLQHQDVGDIVLVVVRYFGGLKLGAGGLTRAYSQAAQAVMERLPLDAYSPQYRAQLKVDFSQEQSVRHTLQQLNATLDEVSYGAGVTLSFYSSKQALKEIAHTAQVQDWEFWQN